ncbi:PepSY domain-containing protein [Listeria booriae]|uniref:PepSY domain-containing protein n=1 Tax=Listeria booriae TaxID=1552123 RepID=UPI00162835CB|nr:PepSY domain-containing protein [Listeria booriae]MBC1512494.1 PepSY domain-containing protein [Listeria booriae]MBC6135456.1 PepSY domain-containing protein [Listeria booriae]MBC6305537.1 PepSY domain-containing protein [Listeria booriae]
MWKKISVLAMTTVMIGALAACGDDDANSNNSSNNNNNTEQTTDSNSNSNSNSSNATDLNNKKFSMSYTDAIEIFKNKHPEADVTSVELSQELGKYVYTIDGVDDNNEYEMKFDADTKAVLQDNNEKLDAEDANGNERANEKLDLSGIKTPQEAMTAALKQQSGTVSEWTIEREMNQTYFEVKIINSNQTFDIKLDAKTLAVLSTEQDD